MTHFRQSNRGFGLTFAALFALIAVAVWWFAESVPVWIIVAAVGFAALALAAPGVLMPLNRLWAVLLTRIALLNKANLLALVYYLVMLPIALVMRAAGRDPMERGRDPARASYWTPVGRGTTRETLRDMF